MHYFLKIKKGIPRSVKARADVAASLSRIVKIARANKSVTDVNTYYAGSVSKIINIIKA